MITRIVMSGPLRGFAGSGSAGGSGPLTGVHERPSRMRVGNRRRRRTTGSCGARNSWTGCDRKSGRQGMPARFPRRTA
jgi:hypothetical protein